MNVIVKRTNLLAIEKFGEIAWNDQFNVSSVNSIVSYFKQLCDNNNIRSYRIEIDGQLAYAQG